MHRLRPAQQQQRLVVSYDEFSETSADPRSGRLVEPSLKLRHGLPFQILAPQDSQIVFSAEIGDRHSLAKSLEAKAAGSKHQAPESVILTDRLCESWNSNFPSDLRW